MDTCDSAHTVEGELTIAHAARLREAWLTLLETGARRFDLSAVREIDTAGIQLIIAAQSHVQGMGGELHFVNPSEPVRDLFERYGLQALASDSPAKARS